ncbi:MAG TPA: response regulator [Flavisolibacter sp.]|jgi:CheY-like chemotaxis protein|nr:response regulator [Flavisolibacter sp.]
MNWKEIIGSLNGYASCEITFIRDGIPFSILVAEDDEEDRLLINEAFDKVGFETEVKKFTNGKMLLQYLEQIDASLYPALIVLDNSLPGLDATDMLHILKSTPAYSNIRVVVYSTLLTPVKKETLLAAGACACIEKGNTMQELVQTATELKRLAEQKVKEP